MVYSVAGLGVKDVGRVSLYILKFVEETAKQTIEIVRGIRDFMQKQKDRIKRELPKIYSQDLLNYIFMYP
jgi:hypothetical protein